MDALKITTRAGTAIAAGALLVVLCSAITSTSGGAPLPERAVGVYRWKMRDDLAGLDPKYVPVVLVEGDGRVLLINEGFGEHDEGRWQRRGDALEVYTAGGWIEAYEGPGDSTIQVGDAPTWFRVADPREADELRARVLRARARMR